MNRRTLLQLAPAAAAAKLNGQLRPNALAALPAEAWRFGAPLPLPRAGLLAGAFRGRLVLAGGSDWQNNLQEKAVYQRCDLFDPRTNQWSAGPPLPAPRCDAACVTLGGAIYAMGGIVGPNAKQWKMEDSVLRFDGRVWREAPEAKLPAPTMYAIAVLADDRTHGQAVYLFGGLEKLGQLETARPRLWCWRPKAGKGWQELAPFPGKRRLACALVAHGKSLFLFGGVNQPKPAAESAALENLAEVWEYRLAENQWRQRQDLPVRRRAWSALSAGAEILLLGGYTTDFQKEVFRYQPGSGQTLPAGELPFPLADARFVTVGDTLWQSGGETAFKIRAPWTIGLGLRELRAVASAAGIR